MLLAQSSTATFGGIFDASHSHSCDCYRLRPCAGGLQRDATTQRQDRDDDDGDPAATTGDDIAHFVSSASRLGRQRRDTCARCGAYRHACTRGRRYGAKTNRRRHDKSLFHCDRQPGDQSDGNTHQARRAERDAIGGTRQQSFVAVHRPIAKAVGALIGPMWDSICREHWRSGL